MNAPDQDRSGSNRLPLLLAATVAVVLCAAAAWVVTGANTHVAPPQAPEAKAAPAPTASAAAFAQKPADPPAKSDAAGPSFDIVRVTPQGNTVAAGRATPNAE